MMLSYKLMVLCYALGQGDISPSVVPQLGRAGLECQWPVTGTAVKQNSSGRAGKFRPLQTVL